MKIINIIIISMIVLALTVAFIFQSSYGFTTYSGDVFLNLSYVYNSYGGQINYSNSDYLFNDSGSPDINETYLNNTILNAVNISSRMEILINCSQINFDNGYGSSQICDGLDATGGGGSQWEIAFPGGLFNDSGYLNTNMTYLDLYFDNDTDTWNTSQEMIDAVNISAYYIFLDPYALLSDLQADYYNSSEIDAFGFVTNATMNQSVDWSNIDSIPSGFADGVDNDTFYTEEQIEDIVGGLITNGDGINVNYDDPANAIVPSVDCAEIAGLGLQCYGIHIIDINETYLNATIDAREIDTWNTSQEMIDAVNISSRMEILINCSQINFDNGYGSSQICDGLDATGGGGSQWEIAFPGGLFNDSGYLNTNITYLDIYFDNDTTLSIEEVQDIIGQSIDPLQMGINFTYDDPLGAFHIDFDCSDVDGDGLSCDGEVMQIDSSTCGANEASKWNSSNMWECVGLGTGGSQWEIAFPGGLFNDSGYLNTNITYLDLYFDNDTDTWNTSQEMIDAVNISAYYLFLDPYAQIDDLVGLLGNWSADQGNYYTSAQIDGFNFLVISDLWDHIYNETEVDTLIADFVTNATMNQSVDWSNIDSIPSGFADGVDNDTDTWNTSQEMIDAVNISSRMEILINCSQINFDNGYGSSQICDGLDATGGGGSQWEIAFPGGLFNDSGYLNTNMTYLDIYFDNDTDTYNTTEEMQDAVGNAILTFTGIDYAYDDPGNGLQFQFDCSDVDGDGLSCDGEVMQIDSSTCGANEASKWNSSNMWECVTMASGSTVNITTNFGGEVSGTYDAIVIGNDVLDDQYYDSEADLTALLDDNYVDVSGDTMTGNLDMNDAQNVTGIKCLVFANGAMIGDCD